ncbi:MAG: glycosyltransferase, partial [Lachnospiraceae bacterium]
MKKYVFIANGFKPTKQERNSREKIKLTNYSLPCLEAANKMGYEIYYGVNRSKPEELNSDMDIKLYDEHIYRNLFDLRSNYIAYRNLMKLLKNEKIEVIHCNTPIGGLIGRICGKKAKIKKVIYTVHGFHFYKGAPLINRTLFMWAEKIMATWTDAIITMNQEDYKTAQTFKLKKDGHVYFINGV